MIDPEEVYHWLGIESYLAVLESYELLPEECLTVPVVEEPDHDE